MDSAYIKALETRLNWLRWAQHEGSPIWSHMDQMADHPHKSYLQALPSYVKTLEAGDTFFMNRNFCSLVEHARQTVPDDLVFDHTWLQSRQGWLWIERPFEVPSIVQDKNQKQHEIFIRTHPDFKVKVSAIGWFPVEEGYQVEGGRKAGPGATEILCFQDFSLYNPDKAGFGCWSYFMLMNGDKLIDRIKQFEHIAMAEGGSYIANRTSDMMHEIRWVYSAFYLMAQRLSVFHEHRTDRATRRRGARQKMVVPPLIRVVSLRRMEEDRKKEKSINVDWQWQWEVRGHWRNQFYQSTGEYKQIFIEAYIKGPEGKPLKPPGHKLFAAVR